MTKMMGFFRVVGQNRKSKARATTGVEVGDIVRYSMNLIPTTGASRGNYALTVQVERYIGTDNDFNNPDNYTLCSSASQNEFFKYYMTVEADSKRHVYDKESAFLVEVLDPHVTFNL